MRIFDYALVGGGLQNALIARALAHYQPEARVALFERAPALGSGHTWCFHESDLPPGFEAVARDFVAHVWEGYDVLFPEYTRTVPGRYLCVTGERLGARLTALFRGHDHWHLRLGVHVRDLTNSAVEVDGGERVPARVVIDARGPEFLEAPAVAGFQKFLGVELELRASAEIRRPVLMDARVPQRDGFRFLYLLPFAARRVLVEDTYFSDTPTLDLAAVRQGILAHGAERGWSIERVVREEVGVLPLPARLTRPSATPPLQAGYRGGWFHPTTGYSFPSAARLADLIGRARPADLFGRELGVLVESQTRQARFGTLLNRLLFEGFDGPNRRHVFERFYRLPEPTIRRFYALRTTALDRARILCGRPPRGISLRRVVAKGARA